MEALELELAGSLGLDPIVDGQVPHRPRGNARVDLDDAEEARKMLQLDGQGAYAKRDMSFETRTERIAA